MKSMIFLVNPRSGREQIKNQLMGILDCFCKCGYFPSVYVTQNAEDARQIAEEYGENTESGCGHGAGEQDRLQSGGCGGRQLPCQAGPDPG